MLECTFRNGLDKNAVSKELVNAVEAQEKLLKYFSTNAAIVDYVESTADTKQDVFDYIQEKTRDVELSRKDAQPNYIPAPYMYFNEFTKNVRRIAGIIWSSTDYQNLNETRGKVKDFYYTIERKYRESDKQLVELNSSLYDMREDTSKTNLVFNYKNDQLNWSTACNLQSSGCKDIFGNHDTIQYDNFDEVVYGVYGNYKGNEVTSDLHVTLAVNLLYVNAEKPTLKYGKEFFTNFRNTKFNMTAYAGMYSPERYLRPVLEYIKGDVDVSKVKDLSNAETSLCHGIIKQFIEFNNEHEIANGLPSEENIVSELQPALTDFILHKKKQFIESIIPFCEDQLCKIEGAIEENINSVEDRSGMRM